MDMMISVMLYLTTLTVTFFMVKVQYRRSVMVTSRELYPSKRKDTTMTTAMIIGIAALFTVYNIVITKMHSTVASDRANYALNFYGYRTSPSEGLTFVINVIRHFSDNVEILYYVSTLIPIAITLIAYKVCEDSSPIAFLFLFCTQYLFHTFAGLKQCYANAFACLCIAFALRNKGVKDTVFSILSIMLAIWFHHTGYFLILIYVMLRIKKSRKTLFMFFVIMTALVFFLEPVLLRASSLISPFVPILSSKIRVYFGETASILGEGKLTLFKGIPYYILTIVGLIKRRQLVDTIENYDNYLFLSSVTSFIYIATIYNGWIYRLSYFFYFPAGVFYGLLMRAMRNMNNRRIIGVMTLGLSLMLTVRFLILTYVNYGGF